MIADEASTEYNPNNISYKQYAPLNMNNLLSRNGCPLSLHGDDPNTKEMNGGEIVRFTIVHSEKDVLGQVPDRHWFVSYGHIGFRDRVNGEAITTAKISASFAFKKGINAFAFPCTIPYEYTTSDLFKAIERAEGQEGSVESIYVFVDNNWVKTYKAFDPLSEPEIVNINPLPPGKGAFIIMNQNMTKEVSFYGEPKSVHIDLFSDAVNILSMPQLPAYYETGHFLKDIESSGAGENSVDSIWFYNGGWKRTYKVINPLLGVQIKNSVPMTNVGFYAVTFKDGAHDLLDFDPFSTGNRSRFRSSNRIFFYD